jgi:hypothetical protein
MSFFVTVLASEKKIRLRVYRRIIIDPAKYHLRRSFMTKNYSIGDTSKLTGISQRRLRSWCENGIIPDAERVVCGCRAYRRYDHTHITIIKEIKRLMENGYTLKAAGEMARSAIIEKGGNV